VQHRSHSVELISALNNVQSVVGSACLVSVVSSSGSVLALVTGGKLGKITVVVTLPNKQ